MKKKLIACALCAVMTLSLVACGDTQTSSDTTTASAKQAEKDSGTLKTTLEDKANVKSGDGSYDKEETVYAFANAEGTINNTVVSEWLKNNERTEDLVDSSDLKDIKNVKGDETFTQGDNNAVTWKANGADIYYQGTTDKELPVTVKVSYKLDGKDISAADLAGKSGKVTIRFDYTNTSKEGDVYTPFLCVSGMILPGDNFENVAVTNGKLVSDGSNNVVVGMALPGLKDSLDMDSELGDLSIDLPEYFEVTADATDFKLDMTLTLATADIFNDIDTSNLNMDSLFDELDSKTAEFQDGVDKLQKGVKQYTNAVAKLAKGAKKLKNGTKKLAAGTSNINTFVKGVKSAKSGADQLQAGYEGDNGAVAGAKKVADGLTQLNTAVQALNLPTASADSQMTDAEKAAIVAQITKEITATLPTALQGYCQKAQTQDPAVMAAYQAAYQTAYQTAYQSGMKAGAQTAVTKINTVIKGLEPQIKTLKDSVSQLAAGSSKLSTGLSQLYKGTKDLDSGLNTLSTKGTELYTAIKSGADTLDKGMGDLSSGASKLNNKSSDLNDGMSDLQDGTGKIVDKVDEVKDDANTYFDKAESIVNAGKNFNSFTSIADGMNGSVKFIIKTDAVEAK